MDGKMINVKCDFCGKEIECPEDLMNPEKHACYGCFWENPEKIGEIELGKLHVDTPTYKAEEMFGQGAMAVSGLMATTAKEGKLKKY